MSPNVLVAPNRNKLIHYILLACTGCTHLVALYWLMVFIHETHVMPSSGYWLFQVVSAAQCVSCSKQEQITTLCTWTGTGCTHLLSLYWLMVFMNETHVTPSSGKVKTKRHLFSYLVLAGSECCPMCQSLQTGTNYHIMYFWLVQVAPSCGIILIDIVYSWNTCDAI